MAKEMAKEIDGLQRKMVSFVCPIRRHRGESFDQYARRRGCHASKLIGHAESWSKHWFDRATSWNEHVERGHSPCKWNRDLLAYHGLGWLQERRAGFAAVISSRLNSWTIWAGRTGTRSAPGKVQPRWQEAMQWVETLKPLDQV